MPKGNCTTVHAHVFANVYTATKYEERLQLCLCLICFTVLYSYLEKDALLLCKDIINRQRTVNTSDEEKVNKMPNGEM